VFQGEAPKLAQQPNVIARQLPAPMTARLVGR
jgi:hypothetical protein